ncbi:MAG: tetratricopeptide repeat protein [Parcubacteria group bacterium]|nr:tetratricopeptide repeat protein [Parcubacteria group bacterium]
MFDYIPQTIVVVALLLIIVVVARKASKTAEAKEGDLPKKESKEWKLIKQSLKMFAHKVKQLSVRFFRLATFRAKEVRQEVKQKAKALPAEQDEEELSQLAEDKPTAVEAAPAANADEIVDLLEKASGYFGKGDFEQAEKVYIEIIAKDPKNFRAYKGLGKIYKRQRNFADARKSFEQVFKIEPDEEETKKELAEIKELE